MTKPKPKSQSAVTRDRRESILRMCGVEAMTASSIASALGLHPRGADHYIYGLAASDPPKLIKSGHGKSTVWMTPALQRARNRVAPAPATPPMPSVQIMPARPEYQSATPVITKERGISVTRCPAPRGRFDVELPPTGGAITADWRARRAGETT